MILQRLYDYYDQNPGAKDADGNLLFPKYGYLSQNVNFKLTLNSNGSLKAFDSVSLNLVLPDIGALDVRRTSGIASSYFFGPEKYVFGSSFQKNIFKPLSDIKKLDNFISIHEEVFYETENKDLKSVLIFLKSLKNPKFDFSEIISVFKRSKKGGCIIICVGDQYLHEQKDLKKFWNDKVKNYKSFRGACLITGEVQNLRKFHGKIKFGMKGLGAPLVSFNQSAHKSYIREEGPLVPVGCKVEFGYRTVLNYLLSSPSNNTLLGDDRAVFWTNDHKDNFFCAIIKKLFGEKEKEGDDTITLVKSSLESFKNGLIPDKLPDTGKFFLALLSSNIGRIYVRDFIEEDFPVIAQRLVQHYKDFSMEGQKVPSLKAIAWVVISGKSRTEKPPKNIYRALLRVIIGGENYPINIALSALGFCMKPGGLTENRAGLLKAYLNRKYRSESKKEISMGLDKSRTNIGYLLGRFLAVAEHIQEVSIERKPNSSFGDSYRSSLGSTPIYVFKDISDKVSAHLSKIKKKNMGYAISLDKEYSEIVGLISTVPKTLTLEEQMEYAIGYQHQHQSRFNKKPSTTSDNRTKESVV